jgi:transcription antitermination protein NusB
MNRHLARTLAMQTLYEWDFQPEKSVYDMLQDNIEAIDHNDDDTDFVKQLIDGVVQHKDKIDTLISQAAPEWPIDQISVIDKSILRLAGYELLFSQEVPAKVVINEAVELGKTFGGDNTSRFVNGVLGTLYRQSDRYEETEDTARESKIELKPDKG